LSRRLEGRRVTRQGLNGRNVLVRTGYLRSSSGPDTIAQVGADDANIAELRRIAPDLAPSIEKLTVPAYILDRNATVRWLNSAALAHFGDLRGKKISQIVEPAYAARARQEFAAKLLGTQESTEATVTVRTADGTRLGVEISSTQLLEHGSIVGVFGLANPADELVSPAADSPHLTPRQLDVLRYLAAGHSTAAIATKLGISIDTVRNHIRGIMERLDVHTRLEAVIRAHDLGLV
jgi:PAS domain S-box-containing protein